MGPLVFTPYFRPQIWGGRRLESKLHKALPPEGKFGESWEISVQPHHVSEVAEGEHAGRTLVDLWNECRAELVGDFSGTQFPLLVKLLDCQELLSVQVHPDDALAQEILGQPNGKTEAWIVLHAEPAGVIYAGFKPGTDPDVLRRALADGTVADHLHS
ncbi:MAG TPA: type I phosphomannose isomerase catalytic subunit, partial [Planctomycetia bacterium]|nr:type I phosphomannose isomerase catalytic subunit [Planctomycetia bacterium]